MSFLGEISNLLTEQGSELWPIVGLSLRISFGATVLAALMAIPLGCLLAMVQFRGRGVILAIISAFMALPPVVVGLLVYLMLSRSGPLGSLGILFTPNAMLIAQTILVLPIILALTIEAISPLQRSYMKLFDAHDAPRLLRLKILIWDARFAITTAVLAGFGRAIAEVGAVIIVGGNINGLTRVMTTTIALETSKGNLELALALGIILLALALSVNFLLHALRHIGRRYEDAVR